METAYISALSALAGSAIGATASFATTWLTQNFQDRVQRKTESLGKRERLYGDFIDEASIQFSRALTTSLDDPSRIVHLYAIRSKLRLFAPANVTEEADSCLTIIINAFNAPNLEAHSIGSLDREKADFIKNFTEACRSDLLD